ncbi:hypothetical protein KIN20_024264 [Parelaphostrongylus tenuis]|uniref:Uncharacterized protein n=1 Tax=Parelaphostrongylus tenuis TaxID=148309 RepID=A0AAD5QTI0_PARTN|nr:hypothetical protein KIN20_024264 [Parelaphostrongylus tenuis]
MHYSELANDCQNHLHADDKTGVLFRANTHMEVYMRSDEEAVVDIGLKLPQLRKVFHVYVVQAHD